MLNSNMGKRGREIVLQKIIQFDTIILQLALISALSYGRLGNNRRRLNT